MSEREILARETTADAISDSKVAPSSRRGGRILADQLAVHRVESVYCVPGESYLGLLDGLYYHRDTIKVITARHEAGAANMAEAYGKLTGRPGICAVTRGPGATNAANGIHTAFQDSTPLILLIGQVGRRMLDREAFQEIDYRKMFGEMAKWVAQIESADRIPEYISRAFHVSTAGRPGPVVLALPEDMLDEITNVEDAKPWVRATQANPAASDIQELERLLALSETPMMLVGGPTWTQQAIDDVTHFAETNGIVVTTSFRSQDCFDNRHPNYAGVAGIGINPKLAERFRKSDLLIVAGARLGEMTTQGYTLLNVPNTTQTLVHAYTGAEEIGRVYTPDLSINSSMPALAAFLRGVVTGRSAARRAGVASARADYEAFIQPTSVPGDVNFGQVVVWLDQNLPEDAVLTNGAGNYTVWLHRFFRHKRYRTQVAPTSGSMGYAVPAAIAVKLARPNTVVVAVSGDGCFQMLGQELATAAQYNARVIFLVVNNGILGTIRMHQEKHYPTHVIGTDLVNPDFVALARAYGAHGELVRRTDEFGAAFERAVASGKPALIEIIVDKDAITPAITLSSLAGPI